MHATANRATLVFELEDEVRERNFHLAPDDEGMAIEGPGKVESLLIVSTDSDEFGLRLESGKSTLVNDDFERLEDWSDELANISAYTDTDGSRVLSVEDYYFHDFIRAEITVSAETTFDWIRAAYTVDR